MDGWGKVSTNAKRINLSTRTFRDLLKDPRLRRVVLPSGTILLKFSWVDEYLELFELKPDNTVNQIVDDVMKSFS